MQRYFLHLPEPELARGRDPRFAFHSAGAAGLAEELQAALRSDLLFERWRALQPAPETINPSLATTDPTATVLGESSLLGVDLTVDTSLDGQTLSHRMRLLAGQQWQLRDVTQATAP